MRRIIHLTVLGVLWLFVVIAIAIFALQWFLPNTGLAMFSHTLTPWLLGPLLIALGYTFYTAQPKIALGITVAIAFTASHLIPTFLPRFEDTPNIIFRLRVMSFNTWINNPGTDLPAIGEVIAKEYPDVIALQEVDSDILAELKAHLDARQPGHFAFMLGDPITEQAFISRYPLTQVGTENDYSRVFKVTALTPEGEVALWSVHAYRTNLLGGRNFLSYRNPRMHRTPDEQFGWLAEQIKEVSGPLIVMGDFNLPYQTAPLQNLKLKEAHQEAGWLFGFTFPASSKHSRQISVFGDSVPVSSPMPLVRLDHIFYNYRWHATRAETLRDTAGSDHAPVVAELGLQR